MEKYGELITNSLDLISFLLLTPEVLRMIAPTATRLISWIIAALLALSLLLLVAFVCAVMVALGAWIPPSWVLSIVLILWVPLILMVMYLGGSRLVDQLSRRVSRHFLALGIVLFFTSRMIAFYGSAVKAGLL
jgi:hypothetical protein